MKKGFALFMMTVGCIVSISACGVSKAPEKSSSSDTVREISIDNGKEAAQETEATEKPTAAAPKSYARIRSKAKIESYGGTVKVGDSAYELYNYVDSSARNYASVVNAVANALKGKADVYDMVVPTSIGITFPDNKSSKVNSSDQKKSIRSIYKKLKHPVKKVSLYDTLMSHRKEYIYFRTDHHWTSRGAYYAYRQFCDAKGITANELAGYPQENFGSFLGSFYLDTNHNKALRQDKVKAYFPIDNKKITMTYHDQNGGKYTSSVIANGKNYSMQLRYCAFLAGDNPYTVIHNKKIKDGSGCVVVKESYGNAFVPYLADHYEKIYVIDYRYWKGSVSKLARRNKVQDVIFINNISMTRNAYLIGKIAQIK
jgi:phage tail protein X